MPFQTVTLSSVGQSGIVALNWREGWPTSVAIYPSTTGTQTSAFTIQYTMDDPQLIGGTSLALWANVSSATGSSGTIFTSSVSTEGVFYSFLSPIAALRLSSTALSSGSLTMKVIQNSAG